MMLCFFLKIFNLVYEFSGKKSRNKIIIIMGLQIFFLLNIRLISMFKIFLIK